MKSGSIILTHLIIITNIPTTVNQICQKTCLIMFSLVHLHSCSYFCELGFLHTNVWTIAINMNIHIPIQARLFLANGEYAIFVHYAPVVKSFTHSRREQQQYNVTGITNHTSISIRKLCDPRNIEYEFLTIFSVFLLRTLLWDREVPLFPFYSWETETLRH